MDFILISVIVGMTILLVCLGIGLWIKNTREDNEEEIDILNINIE